MVVVMPSIWMQLIEKDARERKVGREKQLKRASQRWNILSNEPYADAHLNPQNTGIATRKLRPGTLQRYNILNNVRLDKARHLPLLLSTQDMYARIFFFSLMH